jgi:hypothetical protein
VCWLCIRCVGGFWQCGGFGRRWCRGSRVESEYGSCRSSDPLGDGSSTERSGEEGVGPFCERQGHFVIWMRQRRGEWSERVAIRVCGRACGVWRRTGNGVQTAAPRYSSCRVQLFPRQVTARIQSDRGDSSVKWASPCCISLQSLPLTHNHHGFTQLPQWQR